MKISKKLKKMHQVSLFCFYGLNRLNYLVIEEEKIGYKKFGEVEMYIRPDRLDLEKRYRSLYIQYFIKP